MAKSSAQLTKQISFMQRAGAKLDAFIQTTAIDVLEHYIEHTDIRMVNRFFLAMPKGSRHAAMIEFLLCNFAVVPNTDQSTKKDAPFANAPDKVNDLAGASAKPWFEYKPRPAPDMVMDLQAEVRKLLKKAAGKSAVLSTNKDALQMLAAAVGIAPTDVPTGIALATTKDEATALVDKAKEKAIADQLN